MDIKLQYTVVINSTTSEGKETSINQIEFATSLLRDLVSSGPPKLRLTIVNWCVSATKPYLHPVGE